MAKLRKQLRKKDPPSKTPERAQPVSSEEKIARMLAILALQTVKGRPEQAVMLRIGGFANKEVAEILDTSENGVSALIYQAKQKKTKRLNGSDQS